MAKAKTASPELCAVPGCGQRRVPVFLGWEGNAPITSAYCGAHGPVPKQRHCPECGQPAGRASFAWPAGIPPAGVLNGKVGSVTVDLV